MSEAEDSCAEGRGLRKNVVGEEVIQVKCPFSRNPTSSTMSMIHSKSAVHPRTCIWPSHFELASVCMEKYN